MNYLDKINLEKEKIQGSDVVVLSCGPSLNDYSINKIKSFCKDKIVLCIKHSICLYKEICDYHFFNNNNIITYEYNENTFICSSSQMHSFESEYLFRKLKKSDIHFQVKLSNFNQTTACLNNYDEIEIDHIGFIRPWGPGIITECVFPFLSYCSPSNIYTLGWDYAPKGFSGTGIGHFYDNDFTKNFRNMCNGCVKEENDKLIESSKFLNDYLNSKGIRLCVLSKNSYVSNEIPRIII